MMSRMYVLIGLAMIIGLIMHFLGDIIVPVLIVSAVTAVLIVIFQSVFKEDDSGGEDLKEKTELNEASFSDNRSSYYSTLDARIKQGLLSESQTREAMAARLASSQAAAETGRTERADKDSAPAQRVGAVETRSGDNDADV